MGDELVSIPSDRVSDIALKSESVLSSMSLCELATLCQMEIDQYRRGEQPTDGYALELLHRALMQGDHVAWEWILHCFSGLVIGWLQRHPNRIVACRLESEETYVAQAFERFWETTSLTKPREFNTLAAALQYLQACLNAAILDTLRAYARPREIPLPEPGEVGEPHMEDTSDSSEL